MPVHDLVQFKLEQMPNYLISYLKNKKNVNIIRVLNYNSHDTLIGGFGSMCIPQIPFVDNFTLIMLRKLVLQLQDCFSQEIWEGLSSHSAQAWRHV